MPSSLASVPEIVRVEFPVADALLGVLENAAAVLRALPERLGRVPGDRLGEVLAAVDAVAGLAEAGRVAVTAAALTSGVARPGAATAWVKEHAPIQAAQGAATTGRVAEFVAEAGPGVEGAEAPDRRKETASLRDAVLRGQIQPGVALTVATEFAKIRDRLTDQAARAVLDVMIDQGSQAGSSAVARVTPELVRRFGAPGELQEMQDAARRRMSLTRPKPDGLGGHSYVFVADPVTMATLEARIGPASRPAPGPDGERDPRSPEQRRGQALADLISGVPAALGTAATPSATSQGLQPQWAAGDPDRGRHEPEPGRGPEVDAAPVSAATKTALYVTMSLADLQQRIGGGEVVGGSAAGTVLAPDTVRALACDARIIPVVLGSRSEIVDLGRSVRLFRLQQTRALWLRDRTCTFPGCTAPAHLTDAHHLVHWLDGGATALDNAALLCRYHHSEVHARRLIATTHPPDADGSCVTWNLTDGSYDRTARSRPA